MQFHSTKTIRLILVILCLVIIHVVLRLIDIGGRTPHIEEGYSIRMAGWPWTTVMEQLRTFDPHPPMHYAVMKAWLGLGRGVGAVPDGPMQNVLNPPMDRAAMTWLRSLGVALSLACMLLVGAIGRRLYGPRAAYIAMLLFALSRLEAYWAQSVRYHTLLILWSLLATLVFIEIARREGALRFAGESEDEEPPTRAPAWLWVLYGAAALAGLYTNYFMGLTLFTHYLFLVVRRKLRWPWLAVAAAVAVGFAPWLPVFQAQFGIASETGYKAASVGVTSIPLLFYQMMFRYGLEINTPVEGPVFWFGLAALGAMLWGGLRSNRLFVWLYAFTPVAVLFLISLRKPFFNPHYSLVALPGYCLFLARGTETIIEKLRGRKKEKKEENDSPQRHRDTEEQT